MLSLCANKNFKKSFDSRFTVMQDVILLIVIVPKILNDLLVRNLFLKETNYFP
jgi:hypothetical protein